MYKPKVIFLCRGNSARSQMAEAFLRTYADGHFEIYSAGLEPRGYILPEVYIVMKERGLDMDGQTSKSISKYLGRLHFSHVITVCGDAEEKCPTILLNMGIHEHWPFDDPDKFVGNDAERLAFTRKVRDRIDQRIKKWLKDRNIQLASGSAKQLV